jgi:hypothetical protein
MRRPLFLISGALLLAGCAGAGGPVSGASPQTTAISIGGDATTGAGSTVLVTSHREMRGSTHRVEAMIDEVWRVLPAVYQELGVPVGTVNTATRTLGNSDVTLNRTLAGDRVSRYLNCGSGQTGQPLADQYRVQATLLTVLHPEADGTTRVETRLNGTAANRATSGNAIACGTTGRLEARIAQALALRVTL